MIDILITLFFCLFQVFQFRNATIFHYDGSMTVKCHKYCAFEDGSMSKTWTCAEIDVTSEDEGCICPTGKISLHVFGCYCCMSIIFGEISHSTRPNVSPPTTVSSTEGVIHPVHTKERWSFHKK